MTTPLITPPITTGKQAEQAQIEQLAHFLDSAIPLPFTTYRIGWEPIIGLIPGIGDLVGMLLSGAIIVQAARLGTPKTVLFYMIRTYARRWSSRRFLPYRDRGVRKS